MIEHLYDVLLDPIFDIGDGATLARLAEDEFRVEVVRSNVCQDRFVADPRDISGFQVLEVCLVASVIRFFRMRGSDWARIFVSNFLDNFAVEIEGSEILNSRNWKDYISIDDLWYLAEYSRDMKDKIWLYFNLNLHIFQIVEWRRIIVARQQARAQRIRASLA